MNFLLQLEKDILKLVELRILVARCCKIRKIEHCEVSKFFVYVFALRSEKDTIFELKLHKNDNFYLA